MAFENEFFEMAQALEEHSEMLHVENKLLDTQVRDRMGRRLSFYEDRLLSRNEPWRI